MYLPHFDYLLLISVNYYILHAEKGQNMGGCGHASIMKPGRRLRPTEKRQIQMEQANGPSKTSKFLLFK